MSAIPVEMEHSFVASFPKGIDARWITQNCVLWNEIHHQAEKCEHIRVDARERQPPHDAVNHRTARFPDHLGKGHINLRGVVDRGEFQDFQFFHSSRALNPGHVANLLPEQRSANGGGCRNLSIRSVSFFASNKIVRDFLVALYIQNDDRRSQSDPVVGDLREVDHRHLGEPLLQLVQTCVDETLPFFGGMVFGIFAQITVGPGLQNFLREFVPEFVFQCADFFLEFLLYVVHRRELPPSVPL